MKAIKGIDCTKALPMERILRKWLRCIARVTESWAQFKDLPWWYNERADISVLAGAVWKSGELAVEEFVSEKRRISRNTGKLSRRYKGRIDFYFSVKGQHFIAEAKDCWSGAGDESTDPTFRIGKRLQAALSDIKKVKSYGDRQLAILFVKPVLPAKKRKNAARLIKRWLGLVRKMEFDAVAWYFPESARRIKWKNRLYPGVMILIKERG
jgi:hypothetical protein